MDKEAIAGDLAGKFEAWTAGLSLDERQLLAGLLGRLSGDEVQGYSADLLLSPNLLGSQLRELLLLNL
jgi:hypothetical protein